jgi:hypothetical protein
MIHETETLKRHKSACEFRPVTTTVTGRLVGWTFLVPNSGAASTGKYGWVTRDGEVSGDLLAFRKNCEGNLKAYIKGRMGTAPILALAPTLTPDPPCAPVDREKGER